MKRISAIEFTNYKAFYKNAEENKLVISNGKNVLFYGENGSGKSSIYEGLKQFFNSSDNTIDTTPARHIKVSQSSPFIENEGTSSEAVIEVLNEVSVKVTFTDDNGSEVKVFGIPNSDTHTSNFIAQANLLNSFISYRELLQTYLMENPRDKEEFRIRFANLVIEGILAKQKNSATQQSFLRSWNDLFLPRKMYKVENLEKFSTGLQYELNRINLLLPIILNYFEEGFSASLSIAQNYIDYHHSPKVNRTGYYPICEIDLVVSVWGENIDNEEENHLTVLNEARLSALAISIFLSSLINTPQENFEYKLLFLDDVFIGLDMSNRLPLLKILTHFKKPIIEQFIDANNQNKISERIQELNGAKQTEQEFFFKNYQIFISTYDRYWFEVAKRELESKSPNDWTYFEMFAAKKEGLSFNTPLIYSSLNYLQKAEFHYSKHDYPTCANYLRKALEEKLKILLPINEHYAEYEDIESGVKEIKKLKTLSRYLDKFISFCDSHGINALELIDLKNLKDWYFNPFSHDNIETPIFKRELEIAMDLVKRIEKFSFKVIVSAGTNLYFKLDDGNGETRVYKLELQENLRWIESEKGNILTNPIIKCYEWIKNGKNEVVDWPSDRLFKFFNNKWRALIKKNVPDVPVETFWSHVYLAHNDQPLTSLNTAT